MVLLLYLKGEPNLFSLLPLWRVIFVQLIRVMASENRVLKILLQYLSLPFLSVAAGGDYHHLLQQGRDKGDCSWMKKEPSPPTTGSALLFPVSSVWFALAESRGFGSYSWLAPVAGKSWVQRWEKDRWVTDDAESGFNSYGGFSTSEQHVQDYLWAIL